MKKCRMLSNFSAYDKPPVYLERYMLSFMCMGSRRIKYSSTSSSYIRYLLR
jgi:hypothetical protein